MIHLQKATVTPKSQVVVSNGDLESAANEELQCESTVTTSDTLNPTIPQIRKIPVVKKPLKRGRKKGKKYNELSILHLDHQNSHHSRNIESSWSDRAAKTISKEKTKGNLEVELSAEAEAEAIAFNLRKEIENAKRQANMKTDEEWKRLFSLRDCYVLMVRCDDVKKEEDAIKQEEDQEAGSVNMNQEERTTEKQMISLPNMTIVGREFSCRNCAFSSLRDEFLAHLVTKHGNLKWSGACQICQKDVLTNNNSIVDEFLHNLTHLDAEVKKKEEKANFVISEVRSLVKP
jgi:hypothetical protein